MLRIEEKANAGYTVKVMWECDFEALKTVEKKPHLLTHPMPCTGVELRPCVFTTK